MPATGCGNNPPTNLSISNFRVVMSPLNVRKSVLLGVVLLILTVLKFCDITLPPLLSVSSTYVTMAM